MKVLKWEDITSSQRWTDKINIIARNTKIKKPRTEITIQIFAATQNNFKVIQRGNLLIFTIRRH